MLNVRLPSNTLIRCAVRIERGNVVISIAVVLETSRHKELSSTSL